MKSRKIKHKDRKYKKKYNVTVKRREIIIPTTTPLEVRKVSDSIASQISKKSYSPTINQELVTLVSIPRNELSDCNTENAFNLKVPLKIGIPGTNKCYDYFTKEAKKFLLNNLAADKHIDTKKIIPPIQFQSNCWFNAFFVTFFVSDKGRKFFHFFRQLMIEGKQKDGTVIPNKLRDVFALLNFGIDACLTGNEYAYKLNTNSIIHLLYKGIPKLYKDKYPYIVDTDKAGNPLFYYMSIIDYLNNNDIQILFIRGSDNFWKDKAIELLKNVAHLPHIIVLEVYEDKAMGFNKKPISFTLNAAKYAIDSAVIRDISGQHFCTTITCDKKEFGYDGMSFHRLVPLQWKHKINKNISWEFEGTKDFDGTPLKWNFMKSYQLLMYYRIQ
jgi:hypothetical protein